jgi:hypothetical protein
LTGVLNAEPTLAGYLTAHLNRLGAGDYFALLAYIEMNEAHERALQAMRVAVRDARRVATCLEFGPRFLHSTGQAFKGGPNTGVFLQITCDDAVDVPVPGRKYTFGVVKAAQARGDFEVLVERGRRALRAHLGADVARRWVRCRPPCWQHWVVTAQPSDPRGRWTGAKPRLDVRPAPVWPSPVSSSHHVIPVSEGRGR